MTIELEQSVLKSICKKVQNEPPHMCHYHENANNLLFIYAATPPRSTEDKPTGNFYVIDLSQPPIGQGTYGTVLPAHAIREDKANSPTSQEPINSAEQEDDLVTYTIEEDTPKKDTPHTVVKLQFEDTKKGTTPQIVAAEMAIQNRYYKTEYPYHLNEETDANKQPPPMSLLELDIAMLPQHMHAKASKIPSAKHETSAKHKQVVKVMAAIMPYYSGSDLAELYKKPDKQKLKLDLPQRVNILAELAMAFNILHHHTASTGNAVFMADVKPENILLNIREKEVVKPTGNEKAEQKLEDTGTKTTTEADKIKVADVTPIDFGLAETVKVAQYDDAYQLNQAKGTPSYVAPEVIHRKGGIKSDIYGLTSLVIRLLGGKNPNEEKDALLGIHGVDAIKDIVNQPYTTDGLCHEFEKHFKDTSHLKYNKHTSHLKSLKRAIQGFVTRMQRQDYDQRPGPKEFLRFFVTLNNYFKTFAYLKSDDGKAFKDEERTEYKKDLEIYVSTLVDLANGKLDAISPYQEPRPSQIVEDKTPEIADEEIKDGKQEVPEPNDTKDGGDKSVGTTIKVSLLAEHQSTQQPEQPFVTKEQKEKLLQKILVYKNSEKCSGDKLTYAKAMLAEAFIKKIEGIQVTYTDIKKYTACLKTLNYALEEIAANETKAKRFFGAIKKTKELELYKNALQNLFKTYTEGADANYIIRPHTEPLFENSLGTLLSQSASIINRQKNDANAHVGKHYSRLFSSRLGRAANDIESNLQKLTHNKK